MSIVLQLSQLEQLLSQLEQLLKTTHAPGAGAVVVATKIKIFGCKLAVGIMKEILPTNM